MVTQAIKKKKKSNKKTKHNTLLPPPLHLLHSANKRQSAEVRVATAPVQNALLASQFEHSFPDSHVIYIIVST